MNSPSFRAAGQGMKNKNKAKKIENLSERRRAERREENSPDSCLVYISSPSALVHYCPPATGSSSHEAAHIEGKAFRSKGRPRNLSREDLNGRDDVRPISAPVLYSMTARLNSGAPRSLSIFGRLSSFGSPTPIKRRYKPSDRREERKRLVHRGRDGTKATRQTPAGPV